MKNFILLFAMIALTGCNHASVRRQIERFEPNFFIGDSSTGSITDGKVDISCHHPEFDEFACMHRDKIIEFNKILSRYRRWPVPSNDPVKDLINELSDGRGEL